jgi:hypothetical protein
MRAAVEKSESGERHMKTSIDANHQFKWRP